jgi:hypothetical protein
MPLVEEKVHAHLRAMASSLEAAIAAGNSLARHQIVLSKDFDRLMDRLHEAAEVLDGLILKHEAAVVVEHSPRAPTLKLVYSAPNAPDTEGAAWSR